MALDVTFGANGVIVVQVEPDPIVQAFPLVKESLDNYEALRRWRSDLGYYLNHSFRHFNIHQLPANFILELWADSHLAVEEAWKQYQLRYKMCNLEYQEPITIRTGKRVKC